MDLGRKDIRLKMVCGSKTWIIICMLLLAPFRRKGSSSIVDNVNGEWSRARKKAMQR